MQSTTINKILNPAWKELSPRQTAVLVGRFGLDGKEPVTLDALGKGFGVTRERIRQIEASALTILKAYLAKSEAFASLVAHGKKYLKSMGGVAHESAFVTALAQFSKDANKNNVSLLADATQAFSYYIEDDNYASFYYLDKESMKNATQFVSQWTNGLRANKEAVLAGSYDAKLKEFLKAKSISPSYGETYLSVSKQIGINLYGEKGLAEWPEVDPRTIRDRIYLVLKKKREPLHFEKIADEVNAAGFGGRLALASTCHNELIKDTRFVLVGRGLYALREHGYEPGTAKDVIHKILKVKGPMKAKDIITAVQKERLFKYNTVLVNLQNRALFERSADGTYKVREA